MKVQDVLATATLADLKAQHGVNSRTSARDPSVFTLNYDQIDAREDDVVAQECRGLVLRRVSGAVDDTVIGATEVLARPMHRFFNMGAGACAPVDFDHPETRFYEKLDGTCCIMWHDPRSEDWHVATRSVPDADVPLDGHGLTFRGLFEQAVEESYGVSFGGFVAEHDPACTWVFELTAPENQIVVSYPRRDVTLLAVRETATGVERDPHAVSPVAPACPHYRVGSVPEMLEMIASKDPAQHEGLVVCDPAFNRCKVKHPGYIALNKIRDAVAKTPRAIMEVLLLGKLDDVAHLIPPHVQPKVERLRLGLGLYLAETDDAFKRLYSEDRKTFAVATQREGAWLAALMQRWSGKCDDARGYIESQRKAGTWGDTFLDHLVTESERRAA